MSCWVLVQMGKFLINKINILIFWILKIDIKFSVVFWQTTTNKKNEWVSEWEHKAYYIEGKKENCLKLPKHHRSSIKKKNKKKTFVEIFSCHFMLFVPLPTLNHVYTIYSCCIYILSTQCFYDNICNIFPLLLLLLLLSFYIFILFYFSAILCFLFSFFFVLCLLLCFLFFYAVHQYNFLWLFIFSATESFIH